ncbi:MAG: elongation factor 1-beta [Thermofilaceae archaeon]
MARVVTVVRVLPADAEAPPEQIVELVKSRLPGDTYEVLRSRTEPIAFGITAIYLWIAMPENLEGGTYDLESRLSSIPEISQFDVITVSRLLE